MFDLGKSKLPCEKDNQVCLLTSFLYRYASLEVGNNFKSTFLNILLFYPWSLILTLLCLALSPLSLLLKMIGCHPMDRSTAAVEEQGEGGQVQLLVRTEGGVIITLDVDRKAAVQSLLPEVKSNLGLAFDRKTIHLKFNDALLDESPGSNLDSYGLGNGDVLELVVEPDKVEITVQMENGDVVVVTLNADLTVEALMVQLQTQTGILVDQQWLLLDGERLDMDRVLRTLETTQLELFELLMTLEIEINGAAPEQVIVRRDALYADLREAVAAVSGLNADDIEILFNDQVLDETLTLHAQGLRNGTRLVASSTIEEEDASYDDDDEVEFYDDDEISTSAEEVTTGKGKVYYHDARAGETTWSKPQRKRAPPPAKPVSKKTEPRKEIVEEKKSDDDRLGEVALDELELGRGYGTSELVEEETKQRELVPYDAMKSANQLRYEAKKRRAQERRKRARERRRRIRGYIKDVLRNVRLASKYASTILSAVLS